MQCNYRGASNLAVEETAALKLGLAAHVDTQFAQYRLVRRRDNHAKEGIAVRHGENVQLVDLGAAVGKVVRAKVWGDVERLQTPYMVYSLSVHLWHILKQVERQPTNRLRGSTK